MAFGKPDHRAIIHDLKTGEDRVLLEDPSLGVAHLEFSPDGKTLAIGRVISIELMFTATTSDSHHEETIFLDVATGDQKFVLNDRCHGMFSPDGQSWAVRTLDGIELWDVPTRKPLGVISCLAVSIGLITGGARWLWGITQASSLREYFRA